ncbi:MAG: hypothetical protein LBK58_16420 [Prevotellaceae bacterium]|jgi:hypothetical protein|nr:hypothetical protein [Prevotellaceae bacterium]
MKKIMKMNRMYLKRLLRVIHYCLVLLFPVPVSLLAQYEIILPSDTEQYEKKSLEAVNRLMSEMFNISYTIPDGFVDLKQNGILTKADKSPYMTFCPILQSKDKECILMYSVFPEGVWNNNLSKEDSIAATECPCPPVNPSPYSYMGRNMKHRDVMFLELKDILQTDNFEMDDYISILPEKKSKKWFNADSVFFFNADSTYFFEPLLSGNICQDKYIHCTSMFISKYNHGVIYFKWFFTEKGKRKEQQYLKKLAKNIWFSDDELHLSQQEKEKSFEWLGRVFVEGY